MLACWVDASGIMRACVQEDDAARGGVLKRVGEAGEVEATGGGEIVGVLRNREGEVLEDLLVV